jgi:Zn-dependent protease with chaperone function
MLGISLAAAFLFVVNFFVFFLASSFWHVAAKSLENKPARNRAKIIFALRTFPSAIAFIFVFVFLMPSYFLFEPASPKEILTVKLSALALIGIFGFALAICRLCGNWLATKRMAKNWLAQSEEIEMSDVSVPVYRINHQFPVIAVVGMLRPRMFIADKVFGLLNEEEMQAAIAHEIGHLNAFDNLKSAILRFCRDLLVFAPFNRKLERAWAQNIESAADEYAAERGGKQSAVNLAGALIKIARVVPPGAKLPMPAGAFLIEQQTADVTWRVNRLLQTTENNSVFAENRWFGMKISAWIYSVAFVSALLWLATNREVQYKIHLTYESVVAVLQ